MGDINIKIPPAVQKALAEGRAINAEIQAAQAKFQAAQAEFSQIDPNELKQFEAAWEDEQKNRNVEPLHAMLADEPYTASSMCQNIQQQILDFQETLDSEHEVALEITTSTGTLVTIYVTSISPQEPNLLCFDGFVNNEKAHLVQHISQLNFLIVAKELEDKTQPPRRIGFELPQDKN